MTIPCQTICAYESRNEKIEVIKNYFNRLLATDPDLLSAYLNLKEFLFEFYWEHNPKTLEILPCHQLGVGAYLGIELTNYVQEKSSFGSYLKKVHGYIFFYGQGKWTYSFTVHEDVGELKYEFSGLGYDMNIHDSKATTPHYAFYLNEELDKLLTVPEPYKQEFLPRYKINNNSHYPDNNKITWAWKEGYYDGPISGYCYLNKELHYYNVQEEKPYSLERMYGLYRLSRVEKAKAYIMHFIWKFSVYNKLRYKIYTRLSKYIKNKNFREHAVIGYFTHSEFII